MFRILTRSLLAAALLALAVSAFAQPAQTGTISGEIKDATGAALPGVTITMTSQDRGFSRSTVSDQIGRYVFPAVPIGTYTLSATLQGFETGQATDNLVEQDKTTNVVFTMKLGALTDTIQVIGDTPLVDPTTATAKTSVRRDEFEKLPVGRTYQTLSGIAAGVVAPALGGGHVNAMGALTSQNLFIIDAVDTTDATTGTFGTNLNFESIQEVSVSTSGVSVEYGRAQGAIINVVTKTGTNRFEGSAKYIIVNDKWDVQNSTVNEVSGLSLERVKFDKVNPAYTFTGGGPIWKDRAWFFGAYEHREVTSPQRQTVGTIPEDYQQTTKDKFFNGRGTVQFAEGHTAWVKHYRSPTDGFVIDYFGGFAAERESLTSQDQTAKNWAAQWSGVLKNNWSMEAAVATYAAILTVGTFELSPRLSGAPVFNFADSKYYNGAAFDGFTDRPRKQFNTASNWFLTLGGRSHDVKLGYDLQLVESAASFKFPNAQLYLASSYDQATGNFVPLSRRDYESGASISKGTTHAIYVRDKFQLSDRISFEAGVRWEMQRGESDIGADTVDTNVFAPRVSGTYDLAGDGKTLVLGSFGRYYSGIIQGFSDAFANIPQRTNYDNFVWNGTAYVFSNRVQLGASAFPTNTSLEPSYLDEGTIGFQRQFGRNMAAGVRYITRRWGNLIDDILDFNTAGVSERSVVNYDPADRKYDGIMLSLDRRFSNKWSAQGSYTYSRTEGNHFGDNFTTLGDYLNSNCRSTTDPTIGVNGVIPCREVQNGANKYGNPSYDRPHNFKLNGAFVQPIGPVDLTVGALTQALSKFRYQKERTVNVLLPNGNDSGVTATYFYNERGADPVDGMEFFLDTSAEVTWRIANTNQAGFKAEIFNLTNREEKIRSNNVTWCGTTANAACQTAVTNFGKANARGSYRLPRAYRFSLIYRF